MYALGEGTYKEHVLMQAADSLPATHLEELRAAVGVIDPLVDRDTLEPLIDANERFFETVATQHQVESAALQAASAVPLLVQLVRDWAEEGAFLRKLCYEPVIATLREFVATPGARVLIPGSGLGRLAFESASSLDGAEVFALEQNFHSTFVAAVMLQHDGVGDHMRDAVSFECDEETEECWEAPYPGDGLGRHVVYPSIHLGANWANSSDRLRGVTVPDVDILTVKDVATRAAIALLVGSFPEVFAQSEREEAKLGFDAVLTVFFIDVARDPVESVRAMYDLLERRGGVWVNLGPMAYPGGAMVQLTYTQLRALVVYVGFELLAEREMPCEYNYLPGLRERITHTCFFFVARPVRRERKRASFFAGDAHSDTERDGTGRGFTAPAAEGDADDEDYYDDADDEDLDDDDDEEDDEDDEDEDEEDVVEDRRRRASGQASEPHAHAGAGRAPVELTVELSHP